MKIILTEDQIIKLLSEDYEYSNWHRGNDEIVNTYQDKEHHKWFDKKIDGVDPKLLEEALKNILGFYSKFGYKLKRVIIKDKGEIVGFLIYTNQGEPSIDNNEFVKIKRERNYSGFRTQKPKMDIILSTAINPSYRNKGLFKKMLDVTNVQRPFFVHHSDISPEGFWEKMGCRPIKKLFGGQQNNSLYMCK